MLLPPLSAEVCVRLQLYRARTHAKVLYPRSVGGLHVRGRVSVVTTAMAQLPFLVCSVGAKTGIVMPIWLPAVHVDASHLPAVHVDTSHLPANAEWHEM